MLKCAFYESDITPLLYANMPGYFNERPGKDVKDKIYAKAIVAQGSNGVKVAMVSVEANFITEEFCSIARKRIAKFSDIDPKHVTLSATHIHNGGPMVDWGKLVKSDAQYVRFAAQKAADAVLIANQHLQECRVGYANGCVDDISFHRIYEMRDGTYQTNPGKYNPDIVKPYAGIDPDVTVMRADDKDGNPIGAVVNFACHQDCVGELAFSGDYSSQLSKRLKEAYGVDFVTVFFVGTCGNINHFDVHTDKDTVPEYYRIMGNKLADEVLRVSENLEYSEDDTVAFASKTLSIKKRMVPKEQIPELKKITRTVTLREDEEIGSQSDPDQLKCVFAYDLLNYAKDSAKTKSVPVSFCRIGDNAFYLLPGEVFVQFGQKIKTTTPFKHRFILTNSNGLFGYLPLRNLFMPTVYESKLGCTSYLEPEAGYKITDAAIALADKEAELWQKK